jgi:hypothetical protein
MGRGALLTPAMVMGKETLPFAEPHLVALRQKNGGMYFKEAKTGADEEGLGSARNEMGASANPCSSAGAVQMLASDWTVWWWIVCAAPSPHTPPLSPVAAGRQLLSKAKLSVRSISGYIWVPGELQRFG